ncbi:1945_t:CDS:1, partial [Diversispora eburnea]
MCGKIYKRSLALIKHKKTIQEINTIKPIMYILPERAIEETRQALVYHIKEKLKQNSRHVGNVNIIFSCTKSQFFGVFKRFIHNYYPKTEIYKCIFKGADAYSTLVYILKDKNWGIKYFPQYQKTLVLFHQPSNPNDLDPLQELNESDPLLELDPLQDKILINTKKRMHKSRPIQIIIG